MQPRLQKTLPQFPFSSSITWTNLKSDVDKFFLRVASTIFKTKYYFSFVLAFSTLLKKDKNFFSHSSFIVKNDIKIATTKEKYFLHVKNIFPTTREKYFLL